jgi:hypothetical protein
MAQTQYPLPNDITNVHELGQVLAALLIPHSQTVQRAEEILRNFTTEPRCLPAFFTTMQSSSNVGVRQMAAVMMRSCIKLWTQLDDTSKETIKGGLLECLIKEREYVFFQILLIL